jgi:hypothetical protein
MSKIIRLKLTALIFLSFLYIAPHAKADFLNQVVNTAPKIIKKKINETIKQNIKEKNSREEESCTSNQSCPSTLAPQETVLENKKDILEISDISEKQVILNQGSEAGLKVGTLLNIHRVVRQVSDPETGKTKTMTEKVGKIKLTKVMKGSSVGEIITGASLKIGDLPQVTQ